MKFIQKIRGKRNIIIVLLICTVFLIPNTFVYSAGINSPAEKKEPTQTEQRVERATDIEDKTLQQLVVDTVKLASKYVLRILLALTVLVFLFGLMKFMFKGQESDTARSEGRQMMLWGIIGLFVITSIWGLVTIAASLVGHSDIVVPQFK